MKLNTSLCMWAGREILRAPGQSLMIFLVLALVTAFVGAALLFTDALSHTATIALEKAPSLIIRNISHGGWEPIAVKQSVKAATQVRGVTRATPRLWGLVQGPNGPVTVVGVSHESPALDHEPQHFTPPHIGNAVVGPGIEAIPGSTLQLQTVNRSFSFTVTQKLPATFSATVNDTVLLHEHDARKILEIPDGFASDLAIDVYHASEEEAILPDLATAFPFTVSITTRNQSTGRYSGAITRRGGLFLLVSLPAILALILLVLATNRNQKQYRQEIGLLKTMGWTTGEILYLHGVKSLMIGLPALLTGSTLAYGLVFTDLAIIPANILFDWKSSPPMLWIPWTDMLLNLSVVSSTVMLPWLAAVIWPVFRASATDPQQLVLMREP